MVQDKVLLESGRVERRPDTQTVQALATRGASAITVGQLCTACLVGDWPMSMFRQAQTLCDTCTALDREVARRSGLAEGTRAGRFPGQSARIGGLNDQHDPDWEPIRQAHDYRRGELAGVFLRARSLGVVQLEERHLGQAPIEVIPIDVLRRHDLIPADMPGRVRRFADWLQALDPEGYRRRSATLSDVDTLSNVLIAHERKRQRARSRAELDRAVRDAARLSRALANSAVGVIGSWRCGG
ncbi:hypothetical protein [Isoptericola haloaureus]|uniref:Golgi phosphoprotein 3 GPP34 n=1 Tax=Isoptericola haloaureus TaxID=1542902 RepID=A0ABU7Z5Q2_9MICO